MKICSKCGKKKDLDDFHKKASSKDGRQPKCIECNIATVKHWQAENPEAHEENWKRTTRNTSPIIRKARLYDIHVDDLETLLSNASGVCEICKEKPMRWLVVDHCHNSSFVRGVLCERCNQGLGLFRDNPEYLAAAIEYLNQKPKEYRNFESPPRQRYK